MLQGVFDPHRFLALIRDFIVFEDDGGGKIVKKVAGYHQYHAVRVAVSETLRAGIRSGRPTLRGAYSRGCAVLSKRTMAEERVVAAEVKVLEWSKGERRGKVVGGFDGLL